jgi:predicted anti-sigma-YlaC factor YlaD
LSCREVVEIVTDYLDGALAPDVLARLDEHLGHCDPCRRYIAQVRTTVGLSARVTVLEESPDRDALLAAFRAFKAGSD